MLLKVGGVASSPYFPQTVAISSKVQTCVGLSKENSRWNQNSLWSLSKNYYCFNQLWHQSWYQSWNLGQTERSHIERQDLDNYITQTWRFLFRISRTHWVHHHWNPHHGRILPDVTSMDLWSNWAAKPWTPFSGFTCHGSWAWQITSGGGVGVTDSYDLWSDKWIICSYCNLGQS